MAGTPGDAPLLPSAASEGRAAAPRPRAAVGGSDTALNAAPPTAGGIVYGARPPGDVTASSRPAAAASAPGGELRSAPPRGYAGTTPGAGGAAATADAGDARATSAAQPSPYREGAPRPSPYRESAQPPAIHVHPAPAGGPADPASRGAGTLRPPAATGAAAGSGAARPAGYREPSAGLVPPARSPEPNPASRELPAADPRPAPPPGGDRAAAGGPPGAPPYRPASAPEGRQPLASAGDAPSAARRPPLGSPAPRPAAEGAALAPARPEPASDAGALLRAAHGAIPTVQAERADPSLVGQLRRLSAQLQQAADQIERLGAFLRPAETGAGAPPLDEQQLINLLLSSQRAVPAPMQAEPGVHAGRLKEVADELERLAALVRGAEGGAPPGVASDQQQLLNMLLGGRRGIRATTPEAQQYAQLLELLSALNRR